MTYPRSCGSDHSAVGVDLLPEQRPAIILTAAAVPPPASSSTTLTAAQTRPGGLYGGSLAAVVAASRQDGDRVVAHRSCAVDFSKIPATNSSGLSVLCQC